jgi:hypothetical protein
VRSILLVPAMLAACTTYPDDCNRRALRELRVVENLIVETQRNLERGYSYEIVETGFDTGFVFCSGRWNSTVCVGNDNTYTERPVAIDPESERRKLASLTERRRELRSATASCRPV